MAAGRVDVSRRVEFYRHSKRERDYYRNGSCVVEFGRDRDLGARHKNGYHYSSKARDSGSRRGVFGGRTEQRKHDELSRVNEVSDYEDRVLLPQENKRKFSPIIWDRKEKDVRISSKNRVVPVTLLSPPCQSASSTDGVAFDDASDVGILKPAVSGDDILGLENSADKPAVADELVGFSEFSSPANLSPLLPSERFGDDDYGHDHVEDDEFAQARNIAMSRWASDCDSPRVNEDLPDSRRSSPESGEIQIESSGEGRARSFGSDGEGRTVAHVSRDTFCENESLDVDSMDVDCKQDAGFNMSDSDSEDNGVSLQIEESSLRTQRGINMLQGCRSVYEFEMLNKINEGTYGIVYKAKDKKTGQIVALKKVKMGIEKEGGFPLSSLREINILSSFNHPSVVDVKEVVLDDFDTVFMVMEYMEYDLKCLLGDMKQPFSISEVKCLMLQLLEGVKYLHDNWVLHRDLKTSNLLVSKEGELKICDFGLSRQYGSPLKPFTPVVVTLWYRAPELLLGTKQYSTAIDMWSVGCIMAELVGKEPLFKGKNEVDQLGKIFQILGAPNEETWPGLTKLPGVRPNIKQMHNLLRKKFPARSFTGSPVLSNLGFDLLSKLLAYDPEKRITAEAALNHDWFREVPLPRSDFKLNFPVWHGQER
ncbi:cyclin-dependent kinase G-2-like [Alnus glutinosa]|uniref:cyclin-dependent kinase G-2-like n=1 Tax=Alnus glutinosa TaxID=3517 RepID=UPI002D77A341|nr:cyclin-dependent kinase G-2-like [Alnus glutinosa]